MTNDRCADTDTPWFDGRSDLGERWSSLTAWQPVDGQGWLAINAFLHAGGEPLLVDTGLAALREPFLACVDAAVGLKKLRWIWLSHADADHAGNVAALLDRAPAATLVTSFMGAGKLAMAGVATDRMRLVVPGEDVRIGDLRLIVQRPAYYDAPESLGFFDSRTRTLFAVDSFGALLPRPQARLAGIDETVLVGGLADWSAIDAPWLAHADKAWLSDALALLERLDAARLLSGHLPPATTAAEVARLLGLARAVLLGEGGAPRRAMREAAA